MMGITMMTPVLPVIQVSRLYRHTALRLRLFSSALKVHAPEVENILKSLDPKKATGYDKISPRTLQDGADALAYPLSVLINKIVDLRLCTGCLEACRNLPYPQKGQSS